MERRTERWGENDVWVKGHDYISAAHRLADYEDTGYTPEEIAKLQGDLIQRNAELLKVREKIKNLHNCIGQLDSCVDQLDEINR